MKRILILVTFIALTACQSPNIPAKGSFAGACSYQTNSDNSVDFHCLPAGVTAQPTGIAPTVANTAVPSATPTIQPPATNTPSSGVNLFKDGGFEGPYVYRQNIDGFYHSTPVNWNPFYCDGCPAYRQGTGNPTGLALARPEFKPASQDKDALRIHSGKDAGEYFGFYRAINGGFYQTVDTVPGAQCIVSVYVQSWSGFDGAKDTRDPHKSVLVTDDDKANSQWFILVDLNGGRNAFNGSVISSRAFGYEDGIYDQWAQIGFSFVTTGAKTTVFFDNLRLWPARNNNDYVDDAVLTCSNAPNPTQAPPASATAAAPTSTPVPPGTPTGAGPTAQPTPTQVPPMTPIAGFPDYQNLNPPSIYQVINTAGLKKHKTRVITDSNLIFPGYAYADEIPVRCVVAESDDLDWGSMQPCKPEPTEFFVIRQGTKVFARLLEVGVPEGN